MTKVFDVLLEHRDEIACNACGDCCRGFVAPCQRLRGNLCSIHPKVMGGVDKREQLKQGCNAHADPVEAMDIGYFCKPVDDYIFGKIGIHINKDMKRRGPTGTYIYVDRQDLNRVFKMEI